MSNIIEEIKLYVKHGKLPIVQDKYGEYRICQSITKNTVFTSNRVNKIQELYLGGGMFWKKNEIADNGWKLVNKFYDIPTIPFKVGQKVKVREDIEPLNIDDWNIIKTHVIGKIFTVEEVKKSDTLFYVLKGLRIDISHDWLLPVLEPTRTVDDVLAGLSDEDKEIKRRRLR